MQYLTPSQAVKPIRDGETVAFGGFTAAGAPKAVPRAIADKAIQEHAAGRDFQIQVITGASTGVSLDGALAEAHAVSARLPYQSNPSLRGLINEREVSYRDVDLSGVQQAIRSGELGRIHTAVVEACAVRADGIALTTSGGSSPTICARADRIIVELNAHHRVLEPPSGGLPFHDVFELQDPPHRKPIPICDPRDRIGRATVEVDHGKIVGVVRTNHPDEVNRFCERDPITERIGQNVADFLARELREGRLPAQFPPMQSGVGDVANSVLLAIGQHPGIPPFMMFSEVIQDAVIRLMEAGRITFASGCSLTVSPEVLGRVYENLEVYRHKLILRPQEISNSPEVIRRLGTIAVNTALEVDIFGNVNSTHVLGRHMMNGIGGSGDYARNAFLSIFACPSTAKGGRISTIVPQVTHVDHPEHSVKIVATEYGVADLRGIKSPAERAELIARRCAHPDYREDLLTYLRLAMRDPGHTPLSLNAAFAMHERYQNLQDMHGVDWEAAFSRSACPESALS